MRRFGDLVAGLAFAFTLMIISWHVNNSTLPRYAPDDGGDGGVSEPETSGEATENGVQKLEAIEAPETKALAETHRSAVRRDLNALINLQPVVDRWVNRYQFDEAAVEIFDVDYGVVVASYRADAQMRPRSLYKLFYTYDGYAQIDAGAEDAGQTYIEGRTLGYCLDIIIRESDNACADHMVDEDPPRLERVGQLIRRLGLMNTRNDGLLSSAHDISRMLQYYYWHPEWSADSWQKFRNSALYQGWNLRKGLPSGFTEATVYNKTGFGSGSGGVNVYNDAAMVEFAGGARRYIVVAMTHNPASYTILTQLGKMLEAEILYGG